MVDSVCVFSVNVLSIISDLGADFVWQTDK